jgi:acrylyl-CoA reductase (NADPH)
MCPTSRRLPLWERLARELPLEKLRAMSREVRLDEVPATAQSILAGQVRGRVIVSLAP